MTAEVPQVEILRMLAVESFAGEEWPVLDAIAATLPLNRNRLMDFDDMIPGPSIRRVLRVWGPVLPGSSSWSMASIGDVVRPLQYCATFLMEMDHSVEWLARTVVENSSVHLEALMRRVVGKAWPLGRAVREGMLRRRLDATTGAKLRAYSTIYNAAKHRFDHPANTHMFSLPDAVLAYAVARKLGDQIHVEAGLRAEWSSLSKA